MNSSQIRLLWLGLALVLLGGVTAVWWTQAPHAQDVSIDNTTAVLSNNPRKRFLEKADTHSIPLEQIAQGTAVVDAIPALKSPSFRSVDQMNRLREQDQMMVVQGEDETRAYPLRSLNLHELVHDRLEGEPILVTYCPLCRSGMVYQRTIDNTVYTFGVSGLLYNSDVLFYDHQTQSLWSQLKAKAVVGPMTGTPLEVIPYTMMAWNNLKKRYPGARVLSFKTGYGRNYERDPYERYHRTQRTMFPVERQDARLPNKKPVIGIEFNNQSFALVRDDLSEHQPRTLEVGSDSIVVWKESGEVFVFSVPSEKSFEWTEGNLVDQQGNRLAREGNQLIGPEKTRYDRLAHVESYWFAWANFHPNTEVVR